MYVHQFLKFYGSFFPNWSDEIADLLLNRWNPAATRKIKTLSRGERAKLLLIAALARKPRLLILDEPTDGLDPATIEEVFVALTQWVSAEGRTLVIATHRLDEVERIGDSITILNGGKSLLSSDLDTLRSEWKTIEVTGEIPLEEVKRWKEVADATRQAWSSRIITRSSPLLVLEKLKQFRPAGITVQDMNLREIYLTVLRPGGAHYDFLEKLV
jgi:ABC-2 type transport system ATP-binding protein